MIIAGGVSHFEKFLRDLERHQQLPENPVHKGLQTDRTVFLCSAPESDKNELRNQQLRNCICPINMGCSATSRCTLTCWESPRSYCLVQCL